MTLRMYLNLQRLGRLALSSVLDRDGTSGHINQL